MEAAGTNLFNIPTLYKQWKVSSLNTSLIRSPIPRSGKKSGLKDKITSAALWLRARKLSAKQGSLPMPAVKHHFPQEVRCNNVESRMKGEFPIKPYVCHVILTASLGNLLRSSLRLL